MKITLVRHGETEANYLSKIQGRSNPLLNDTGRRQCQKLRNRISNNHYDICVLEYINGKNYYEIGENPSGDVIKKIAKLHFMCYNVLR